jgi:serine/threonine protein kinase
LASHIPLLGIVDDSLMTLKLPTKYGKYILLRKIATGGMAEIFRAKTIGAEGFEKIVVIKRILPHYTEDEAFVKMFIDEASIASKLQHSNIVQIYDFEKEEDRFYIAMEYVEGSDLKEVIERGLKNGNPLQPPQVALVMMEASKGLHYAHTKEYNGQALNIVHRDISPHNIMVSYMGEVKLMDFGIAKAAQRSTKTMAGTVKGKCAYMSPEQARGKPLDGRSDLFALGIMMWEMLTQKRLFLGNSDFETLSNVLKSEVPPPSSLNADVPPQLDAIVLRALAKDREGRQASVEVFGRELTKWFYSAMDDIDQVVLKPFLSDLFDDEIQNLKTQYEEERLMQAEISKPAVPISEDMASHAEQTLALNMDDPHSAATLLDGQLDQGQVEAAMRQGAADGATIALPMGRTPGGGLPTSPAGSSFQQSTGAFPKSHTGTFAGKAQRNRKAIFVAGGAAAMIAIATVIGLLSGDGGEGATGKAATEAATDASVAATDGYKLSYLVTPKAAKVTADGKAVDGAINGLKKGQVVRLVAEAPGYDRLEKLITISESDNMVALSMVKAANQLIPIVINPDAKDALLVIDGKEIGRGTQTYKGESGSKVVVEVRPADGSEPYFKRFSVSEDTTVVTIPTPEPAAAATGQIAVKVTPSDAEVTSSVGKVEKRGGRFMVSEIPIGSTVKIVVDKKGYRKRTEKVELDSPSKGINIELKKKGIEKGFGTLYINAKPWAKISVNGVDKGTTPVTMKKTSSGYYRITFTKGKTKKTKGVTVYPNKKATAFINFD